MLKGKEVLFLHISLVVKNLEIALHRTDSVLFIWPQTESSKWIV